MPKQPQRGYKKQLKMAESAVCHVSYPLYDENGAQAHASGLLHGKMQHGAQLALEDSKQRVNLLNVSRSIVTDRQESNFMVTIFSKDREAFACKLHQAPAASTASPSGKPFSSRKSGGFCPT